MFNVRVLPLIGSVVLATVASMLIGGVAEAEPRTAADRSHYVTEQAPLYMIDVELTDGDFDENENPITPMGYVITSLYEDHGAIGAVNDHREAIYAPIGSVVDYGTGTATVTIDGLAFCDDGTEVRCTGTEFDPWARWTV